MRIEVSAMLVLETYQEAHCPGVGVPKICEVPVLSVTRGVASFEVLLIRIRPDGERDRETDAEHMNRDPDDHCGEGLGEGPAKGQREHD